MPNRNDPLINPADFETIKLKINLLNFTTKGEIRDGKRSYGTEMKKEKNKSASGEKLEVRISEFLDDGLILEIPSKTCAENHNIEIQVTTENAIPEVSFKATLRVNSIQKASPTLDIAETTFLQKDEEEWAKFLEVFNQRQNEIKNFFNSVRGFEGL